MMNDDIKEILDDLLFTTTLPNVSIKLNKEKLNQLLDYITNLQQELKYQEEAEIEYNEKHTKLMEEYKRLKEENERLKIKCDFLVGKKLAEIDKNAKQIKIKAIEQEDYKSRCEKAVEYIMSELVDEWSIKNDGYVHGSDLPVDAITPILDILNGRSDE